MHYSAGLLIFLLSSSGLHYSLTQSTAQPNFAANACSGVNYTAGSTYRSNLGVLLTDLSINANSGSRFSKSTFGQDPNTVYGLFMCRGDITSDECFLCVKTASGNITLACPNQEVAIIWYDLCMLRYSNQSIFSTLQSSPSYYMWNLNNGTNSSQFRQSVTDLVGGLAKEAANSTLLFADGARNYSSSIELYGLVQCTPDISQDDCLNCLNQTENVIIRYGVNGFQGGRSLMPSCNMRFEIYPFYESSIAAPTPAPSPPGIRSLSV